MYVLAEPAGKRAVEGDSPVRKKTYTPDRHLSTFGHVKPGRNPRGPSRKAKHI